MAVAQNTANLVTVVLPEEPDNIDGCNANRSSTGRVVRNNIVEALAEINPADGSVKPRLATSWERIDEFRWRFKLRQGVKFHDGEDFNAANFIKGMARTMDPKMDCETRTRMFGGLKVTSEAVDTYTVDVISDKAVPILPTYMATLMLVSPKQPTDKLSTPVGTGPYQYVSSTNEEIRAKRNDSWWGGKPPVENVRYVWRTESSVRAAMVKIGEADITPVISVNDANDTAIDQSYPNSETSMLRIDALVPPLNDRRVRLALNLAFDRKAMPGTMLSKDVIPATQAVGMNIAGHNFDIDKNPIPYDPARAKQLLAEAKAAGVPVDAEITMWGRLGLYPNSTEVMETFMTWFKNVGLNVKVRMLEVAEWRKLNVAPFAENRPPNLLQTQHDNNNGDPVFSVFYKYACGGAASTYCDPEFDKEIVRAGSLLGQERVAAWQKIFRSIHEDRLPEVIMYHMVGYARVGKRINFKPTVATNSEIQISQITFK